ncbi:MAG TPA: alpha/beta hydrolase [Candidatus Binatia bacterium]|nr:alpha/beta hydrolase [Candidatus Binatia bacterium]
MAEESFEVQRAVVRDGVRLAYVREGDGGMPLLLVHGYPETKRIWWRNIRPLADAGFEVIVPDLRGFADSDLAPDDRYDVAAHARDMHALVHDVLGHDACVAAAGDLGGVVVEDLCLRYPGFVVRQCLFNTVVPFLAAEYEAAGIPAQPGRDARPQTDYFLRQATDADGLARELDTPERRRAYIADFYGHRFWAAPGTFARADVDFMTEPFADAAKLRASWANYEYATGNRTAPEPVFLFSKIDVPTLVLWGPEDHVVPDDFTRKAKVAFTEIVGPFVVEGAGHFLQWEAAHVFNQAMRYFCADLVTGRRSRAAAR